MAWLNADGLNVQFGPEEAALNRGGEYTTLGSHRVSEFMVDLVVDPASTTPTLLGANSSSAYNGSGSLGVELPEGARIEKIELITMTAATSGGSATLDVGLKQRGDRSTEIDHDGLIAAGALATFNAVGETVTYTAGTTAAGALLGTTLATSGLICVNYGTAAFTAGKVHVRVYWRPVQVTN